MTGFTPDQWLIVGLIFLLGLVLGMMLMAGGKWKRRYKEEVRLHDEERKRREALESDNERLTRDSRQMDTLRGAAARDEARHRRDERIAGSHADRTVESTDHPNDRIDPATGKPISRS